MQHARSMEGVQFKETQRTFNLLITKPQPHIEAIKDRHLSQGLHGEKESQQFSLQVLKL